MIGYRVHSTDGWMHGRIGLTGIRMHEHGRIGPTDIHEHGRIGPTTLLITSQRCVS